MDRTDRDIVTLLNANGRRSNVEIARELGLSEGTVRKRIDRLLSTGTLEIRGSVAPDRAGFATRALFFINVDLSQLYETVAFLEAMPEVMRILRTTGEFDLVVEAAFGSDGALADFLMTRLSQVPGIVSTKTSHVLDVPKTAKSWRVPDPDAAMIMVVDDDPDFCETTRLVLEHEGYQVRTAPNGDAALRDMIVDPPDLVLLDIMMDGVLDGWDASWRIRNNRILRHVPILVISSITTTDYLGMVPTDEDNLIDNFMSKPVSPDALLAQVERLLRRRQTNP